MHTHAHLLHLPLHPSFLPLTAVFSEWSCPLPNLNRVLCKERLPSALGSAPQLCSYKRECCRTCVCESWTVSVSQTVLFIWLQGWEGLWEGGRVRGRERESTVKHVTVQLWPGLVGSLTAVVSPELWESTFSPEGASQTVRKIVCARQREAGGGIESESRLCSALPLSL